MRFGMQIPYLIGIIRRFREHRTNPVKMIFFQTMADIFFMLYLSNRNVEIHDLENQNILGEGYKGVLKCGELD